jgi:hypothetical protein
MSDYHIMIDTRGTRWIGGIWQDVTFATRLLAKERWFSAASVLALPLGMAVTILRCE